MPKEKGFPGFWLAFSDAKSAPQKMGNVQSLQVVSGEESHTLWGSFQAMAISPDGKWLAQAAGMPAGIVEIWDAVTGRNCKAFLRLDWWFAESRLAMTAAGSSPSARKAIP